MTSVLGSHRPLSPDLYARNIPKSKRRRIQVSDTRSWDGPEDGLSVLNHTYEYFRVGTHALVILPLLCYDYLQKKCRVREVHVSGSAERYPGYLAYNIEVENEIDGLLWLRNLEDSNPDEARLTLYIQTPRYYSFVLENQRQDRYIAGKVHSMNVLRFGFDMEDSAKNPVVLTITVDYSLDPPAWVDLCGSMLNCFKTELVDDVPIEFERGEVFLSVDRREELKMVGLKPGQIECSYSKPVGTAGVVLEIFKAGATELLTTVVLTNHHVIQVDNHGYSVLAQQCLAKDISPCVFRSPNFGAIKSTISALEAEMAELDVDIPVLEGEGLEEIEEDIEKVRRLIRKVQDPDYPVQQLGCVWYSGGFSRKVPGLGGRLDVAAISLENEAALNASNDISHRADEWKQLARPRVTAIKDIDTNFGTAISHHDTQRVFKIGAMTGCTTGNICPDTRSKFRLGWHPETDMTDEISIVGDGDLYTDMFGWEGDSGAAIFNAGGKWLGLLYGGQTSLNSRQLLTYVIPASAIIADMVELSGYKIDVRLKA
ncbi:hypothetical protein MBM_09407 [Drepanopeziza brunnea f. sp. 'multigermtubi' MB_m1]|uniref:Uncharacterized protein n=1 Tax=Marssonina brunnea f. sp. multigermtubi (strain MB_m1) TaxID=1072389 RepID=K1WUQ8_MARBU|nr:uncharacterized protein MBM_09407 [Drepanopeziza brunnea f. sp. 'multigermtubi' MB_m1]EKD12373.1 hypothetical protein MBM_09407 [Drepanopeziza brunnea f. sp. 'multigermtubi' MB_m1]